MRRLLPLLMACLLGVASAQQSATLAGVIQSDDPLPDGTRVALQVLDGDDAWVHEAATTAPLGGSFSLDAGEIPDDLLRPFRSGAILLPGLQNEYRVEPEGVRFAKGSLSMYLDDDGDGRFTREPERDPFYLALAQLEDPIGFFTLIYVDSAASMSGRGVSFELEPGWNVFTVRFPEAGAEYELTDVVDDIALEVLDIVRR